MRRRRGWRAQQRLYNHMSREIAEAARRATEGEGSSVWVMGRTFETLVFRSDDDANGFMARNANWGVLCVDGRDVHLARMDDRGSA